LKFCNLQLWVNLVLGGWDVKLLKTAVAVAFLVAAGLPASATDQDINITATVTGFCTIDGSLTPAADNVNWDALVTSGFITATPSNQTYAVLCNRASDISLTSLNGALTTATAAAAGFDNIIDYTASTSGFATIAAGSTATTPTAVGSESLGTTSRATPGAANITVTITPIVNTNPLVAGTYNDTLRLAITPVP
jgi:hypothetical protein